MLKKRQKHYKEQEIEQEIIPTKMDKELQKLIDERQELIDKLCMEIVAVEKGIIKIPVEAK